MAASKRLVLTLSRRGAGDLHCAIQGGDGIAGDVDLQALVVQAGQNLLGAWDEAAVLQLASLESASASDVGKKVPGREDMTRSEVLRRLYSRRHQGGGERHQHCARQNVVSGTWTHKSAQRCARIQGTMFVPIVGRAY